MSGPLAHERRERRRRLQEILVMRLRARTIADDDAVAAALGIRFGAAGAAGVGLGDGLAVKPVFDDGDMVDADRAHRVGQRGRRRDGSLASQQRRPIQPHARQQLGAQLGVERVEVAVQPVCRLVEDQVVDLPVGGDVEPPRLAQQVDHVGRRRHPVEDRQRVRLQRRAALGGAAPVEHGALGAESGQRLLALPDAVLGALRDRQLGQDQHPRRHHLGGTARRRGGVGGVGGDRCALRQLGRAGAAQPAADPARLPAQQPGEVQRGPGRPVAQHRRRQLPRRPQRPRGAPRGGAPDHPDLRVAQLHLALQVGGAQRVQVGALLGGAQLFAQRLEAFGWLLVRSGVGRWRDGISFHAACVADCAAEKQRPARQLSALPPPRDTLVRLG